MQKFPEVPDRKREDACTKRDPLGKRKKPVLFSAVTGEVTTLKIFLAADGKPNAAVFK